MSEHKIIINRREHTEIGGVEGVISFDEDEVCLKTVCGTLTIEGTGLNITRLDTDGGEVHIDGEISSLYYPGTAEQKRGFFQRVFG